MNAARKLACIVVLAVCAVSLAANWLAPAGYAKQFRCRCSKDNPR